MKKNIFLLFFLILSLLPLKNRAQDEKADLLSQAVDAYYKNDLKKALELFLKLEDDAEGNGHLFYNMANTYYRLGEVGEAIQFYEKARRLIPRHPDVRANLRFVEKKRVDQISPSMEHQFTSIFFFWADFLTLRELILLLLLVWIIFWGLFASFLLTKNRLLKRASLGFFVLLFLLALSAFIKYRTEEMRTWGVILKPEVDVRPTYLESVEPLFKLHEGTLVQITDRQEFGKEDSWVYLSLPNGAKGWVPLKMVGII